LRPADSWTDQVAILGSPEKGWKPVSRLALSIWVVFFGLFLFQLARGTGSILDMDKVFLLIHQGGHLLFQYFGTLIGVAGGTFLQLLVPFVLALSFAVQREPQGVAFCMFFFFEQFLPIAAYMADARAQVLPLLTVGDSGFAIHDWNYLFTKMGVLQHDTVIAAWVRFFGWTGMVFVVFWLVWRGFNGAPRKRVPAQS
jgi:hypothetical protein